MCEAAADQLAIVDLRLDEFEGRLKVHMQSLGIAELAGDELAQLGLDVAPDPAQWLDQQAEHNGD